jgi:hypothetical protein
MRFLALTLAIALAAYGAITLVTTTAETINRAVHARVAAIDLQSR